MYRGRLGAFYWLLGGRKFREACETCHRFVDEAVQKALKKNDGERGPEYSQKEKYSFLNALIQETHDPKFVRDQCLNILLAGRDTTACLLSWTLFVYFLPEPFFTVPCLLIPLSKNPENLEIPANGTRWQSSPRPSPKRALQTPLRNQNGDRHRSRRTPSHD